MRIHIINGPNMNMLNRREDIYGGRALSDINCDTEKMFPDHTFTFCQSNVEGEIVGFIQEASLNADAVIINAAAYTHYSIAIRDALSIVRAIKVEVHLTNIYAREEFRHNSVISAVCDGVISGFGADVYALAVQAVIKISGGKK